jgi:hypothetical protein
VRSLAALSRGDVHVFGPNSTATAVLALHGRRFAPIMAVGCESSCRVSARATVVVAVRRTASARAVRLRVVIPSVQMSTGEVRVLRLRFTRRQWRTVRRGKSARIRVDLSMQSGSGSARAYQGFKLRVS